MTPEEAAENAVQILQQAAVVGTAPARVAALVQVADGWTRLHTALANAPKTIEPAPGEPAEIASLPVEVRQLVHAVDRMRDDWAEADADRRHNLWTNVHAANERVWNRLDPPATAPDPYAQVFDRM